ncbi:MAG TPA: DUF1460 domain-containing protein, partial [Ignavibacteriaceae bacterium]
MKTLLLVILLMGYALPQVYSDSDITVFKSKFAYASAANLSSESITDIVADIGKTFLGVPYLAQGIEKEGDEQLIINL